MRRRDGNRKRRIERQDEAAARQLRYDALTPDEKVIQASLRPGNSLRELRRFDLEAEPIGGVRLA